MTAFPTLKLRGVVPVIPTPFRADESIDLDGIAACIEFAVRCGVGAVCLPAYASEFYKLTEAERRGVLEAAIRSAAGRVAILAQSNHPSARCAADLARRHADMGADVISFAIPRQFGLPLGDLLDYCRIICRAVALPVLIQDFNPGGPTVGAEFARTLHADCPNFRYLKLEEPLMSGKVRAIREATNDEVGVLEGWGGMYVLDLLPAGICGLMPGLGPADLLQTRHLRTVRRSARPVRAPAAAARVFAAEHGAVLMPGEAAPDAARRAQGIQSLCPQTHLDPGRTVAGLWGSAQPPRPGGRRTDRPGNWSF
jgi:4-hydroxy-tetrahydrodipicolinate synthase